MTFAENLALARRELAERPLVMRSKPTFLGVVLTTRCHLDCAMCHRVKVSGELPEGFGAKLRPVLPYLEQLHWQGGEVFLVPEFEALFEEAARRPELTQFIVTAGLLIDARWAERLAGARCGLTFSVDSAVPATYARIRRGGELEGVEDALARLAEAGGAALPKTLHAVAMEENAEDLSSVVDFALRHGMRHVDITPKLPISRGEEAPALLRQAALAREKAARAGLSLTDRVTSALGLAPQAARDWDCRIPWRGLFVNAEHDNGAIMPDCMCHPRPVGHVGRDELLDAWNGEPMREYRRRVLAKDVSGWCNAACTAEGVNPDAWFASSFKRLSAARLS